MNLVKSIISVSTSAISSLHSLLMCDFQLKKKMQIFAAFSKITLKLALSKLVNLQTEKTLGFLIKFVGYNNFYLCFRDIFVRNDYYFLTNKKQPLIIDAGGNIGIATLYFKWLYPYSEVHTFEPEPRIFTLLKENVEYNKVTRVKIYNSALAKSACQTSFYLDRTFPGSLHTSTKFGRMPKDKIIVNAVKLSYFITLFGKRKIDLLKMDIEGAESEVLLDLAQNDCLQKINQMIIEYHHNIPGEKNKFSDFLKILEDADFFYQIKSTNPPPHKQ